MHIYFGVCVLEYVYCHDCKRKHVSPYLKKTTQNENKREDLSLADPDVRNSAAPEMDSQRWKAFKNGDEASFISIYTQYFPVLFNFGHQFTRDKELVKDLIQDLFIELKQKRKNLGNTDSIKFYLLKSYRRKLLYHLKKEKVNISKEQIFLKDTFEIELTHESHLINAQLNDEIKVRLSKALNGLTERQREILIYFFHEGLSYEEITAIMEFSKIEYARVLMSRSLSKLRGILSDFRKKI